MAIAVVEQQRHDEIYAKEIAEQYEMKGRVLEYKLQK